MAFIEIVIAVAYYLQVCNAQVNNGQTFSPYFKFNTIGNSEQANLQKVADNTNFRENYINFAANRLSQNKLSQKRLFDVFNQNTATFGNYKNNIIAPNSNQQLFNLQQNNIQTQDMPNSLASWNTLQEQNLANNVNFSPANETPLTANILPAPNIANNNFLSTTIPKQPIISPSLTISTSLPSFIPKTHSTSSLIKFQPRNQVSQEINSNKLYVLPAEPPKVITDNSAGNYYYVSPSSNNLPANTNVNSHKSLNMQTLMPLILNLLNDKNEGCECCSQCHRCSDSNNLEEFPFIDSGYFKLKTYGPPSDESFEDSDSEEEVNYIERRKARFRKNQERKRKYHRNNFAEADKESTSDED